MSEAAVKKASVGRNPRNLILAAVAILLAFAAGGGMYVWKMKHSAKSPQAAVAASPFNLPLPTMMATLDSDSGHASFVRVTAQLQLASEQDAGVVRQKFPQIEDLFQTYLHDTRPDELSGSGIYRLREALFAQISNVLAPVSLRDLFFTELLVQ